MSAHMVQLSGWGTNDNIFQQVDASHFAQRGSIRPWEHAVIGGVQGGHYKVGFMGGALAGALTAPNQILSLRWAATDRRLILYRMSLGVLCTAFSSGISLDLAVYKTSAATTNSSGTGSTTPTPTPVRNLMGQSMLLTSGELRVHGTVALTAGSQTLSTSPLAYDVKQITAVQQYSTYDLVRSIEMANHPMYLEAAEGLVVRLESLNLPASNTIRLVGTMEWVETAAL